MKATITIEDGESEGKIDVKIEFDPDMDRSSHAHELAAGVFLAIKRGSSESLESDDEDEGAGHD